MKLDKSPFVIISVIGQELLAQGKYSSAVEVLESALKIGTCSLKLRLSIHLRRTFNIANFNYRQGVAFQCLARHTDALAAFANGLAQDPKSPQLLDGLVEAAMKSPLKPTLEPTYR